MSTKKTDNTDPKAAAPEAAKPEPHSDEQLLEMSGAFERKYAAEIQARVDAGLTREQAVDVQKAQIALDLRRAKEAAEKAK